MREVILWAVGLGAFFGFGLGYWLRGVIYRRQPPPRPVVYTVRTRPSGMPQG